jgi:hypothetical protein
MNGSIPRAQDAETDVTVVDTVVTDIHRVRTRGLEFHVSANDREPMLLRVEAIPYVHYRLAMIL